MIVPRITVANMAATENRREQILGELQHWSLFGNVAMSDVDSMAQTDLEWIAKRIGGSVDLQIELDQPSEETVLALLNAGAAAIICQHEHAVGLDSVPPSRLTHLYDSNERTLTAGDLIESTKPDADRLAHLEEIQVDCLIDSRLLEERPNLIADFLAATLVSDRPDGLWSTIIVDPLGQALGLAYSNHQSLLDAITHRRGTYWSRSRDELWIKGASSGATQKLLGIRLDCDRDCLRFQVTQDPPGFCHRKTHTCFGAERTIETVVQRLIQRIESADKNSFTKKLVNDPEMLTTKLLEEAQELAEASDPNEIAWEAADVLYFSLVKMLSAGVKLEQVHQELARRMNRVVRRGPGIKSS